MFKLHACHFQVAGFQNKRDIRHRYLDFVCLFLLTLLVHVTWWLLASDGSEIQVGVEDEHFTSNKCYFSKVLCILGTWVLYISIHKLLDLHAIIKIA